MIARVQKTISVGDTFTLRTQDVQQYVRLFKFIFKERENRIRDSNGKKGGMRDLRKKGAEMQDQDPLPDPVIL